MSLTIVSHAKVNLSLDVLEKRPEDGYHYLKSVMLPISLADRITLEPADMTSVRCIPDIPGSPDENLAMRAARMFQDETGYAGGTAITIEKRIPVAGGLAGGSTNAAAVLKGLNRLWQKGVSDAELIRMGIRLGSDVPFFIAERPARVEGIGERLTPLSAAIPLWMVLATPEVTKSTGSVFGWFDELRQVDRPDIAAMEAALVAGDVAAIAGALGNVLEQVMLPRYPEIARLKRAMIALGARGALMSGAGPTVFGLVESEEEGRVLLGRLQDICTRTYLVRSVIPGGGSIAFGPDHADASGSA